MSAMGSRSMETAVLALAENAHMPSLTLQLSGLATNDNGQRYEAAMYPLPPWQPASGFTVDRALIYALVKHESQFDPDAVSDRGACGLMQIMPSTARQFSNDNQPGNDCPDGLFDPATNLEMGQKYVRVLAGQPMIGDNLLLLLAAYNGGPGNLSHWLDGDDRADPLLFVESMPLRETRDYVQQVLLQYWMYRARLSEPETSIAQLARGEWPRYALNDNEIRRAGVRKTEVVASR
jgi:soluble lytic murein transglycosylase-like protein